jgi:hypothetical protein
VVQFQPIGLQRFSMLDQTVPPASAGFGRIDVQTIDVTLLHGEIGYHAVSVRPNPQLAVRNNDVLEHVQSLFQRELLPRW